MVQRAKRLSIGIIDIGLGNLGSLRNALYSLGWDTCAVKDARTLNDVGHLLLPGVGAYSTAMQRLRDAGLDEAIRAHVGAGKPLMGICLGMQLLAESGTEGGETPGLGLIKGKVVQIENECELPLPHVGWNEVSQTRRHQILRNIRNDVDFYFVHSYRFQVISNDEVLAETEYGIKFASIVAKGSAIGVQFHPEKSQINGLRILDNFCSWDGSC